MKIKITKVHQFDRTEVTRYENKLLIWWKKLWGSYIEPLKMYQYSANCECRLIDDVDLKGSIIMMKACNYWRVVKVFKSERMLPYLMLNSIAFSPDKIFREELLGEAIIVSKSFSEGSSEWRS